MITKQIADELVKNHENFYRKDLKIGDVDVYVYNYLLADYDSFKSQYATEIRGLTITKENAKERIFLSIPKFFNLNETPENNIKILQNKKIKKVQDKADGSMIQFIQVNGEVLAKSKQSFKSPQAIQAQEILDTSSELKFFILDCWENNYHPNFELVGPDNKHVVEYKDNELILIAVRDDEGHFIDIDKFKYKYTAESFDIQEYTLEKMMTDQLNQKDTEGYVVKFTDGSIIKIKTLDYIQKHRLQSEGDSSKIVLQKILNEELDDILGVVHEDKKEKLLVYSNLLTNYVNHWVVFCYDESRNIQDRKPLAEKFVKHEFFGVIMQSINKSSIDEVKKLLITKLLSKYNREKKAQEFFKFLESK